MDNVCRLCSSKTELKNVFDTCISGNMKDVIKIASGIEILETDEISKKVCLQCCTLSVKVYQFHQRSSKNNQELMDAYDKRKQLELSKIALDKKDNTANNNTKNNNISRTKNIENRKKSIKFHTSIIQMKKKYPNLKFPQLNPNSHFQPFITLLTNEVSDWYKNKKFRKDVIFQVDENSVQRPKTPKSVVCSSSQNKNVNVNQVENKSSKKIEEMKTNGVAKQNKHEEILTKKIEAENSRTIAKQNICNRIEDKEEIMMTEKKQMECQTVQKRTSIGQAQNKEEDMKRKRSTEEILSNKKIKNTENLKVTNVEKTKSSTQVQCQKETSEKVTDESTIEKQRDNMPHKMNESIEMEKKEKNKPQSTIEQNNSKDIQRKTTELMPRKKNEIQKQSSTKEIENETSIQMNRKQACDRSTEKGNRVNVVQQRNETEIKKHEVSSDHIIDKQSNSKRTESNSDELLMQKNSILTREQDMNEKFQKKAAVNEKISRKTTEKQFNDQRLGTNSTKSEESYSKTAQKVINKNVTTSEKSSTDINAIKSKEASLKKRNADMIQSSSPKKAKISKEVCQPSTANLDNDQNTEKILRKNDETSPVCVILQRLEKKESPVTSTSEKTKEAVINFSWLREVLKGKLKGGSSPEKMQEVDNKNPQQKVVENNVSTILSNNSNDANKLNNIPNNNHNKIDFAKSLNLMPCSENAEYRTYTNNEMVSVRFVKFCCKYCNAPHSTLKSLKKHEKKYHTSCAFCSHYLESLEDRKKHMIFYCPKRTIKIPKVLLPKVDKQKQIVSKYARAFLSLNSENQKSSSEPTQNTEIRGNDEPVNSECDIPDHKPIFNIPVYNVTNTINSRNLKDIYNTIKNCALYTLDPIVEDPINREYYLKKLSSELCFQKVKITLTHAKNIQFQFDKSKNLPYVTNKKNLWDNETVTNPLTSMKSHQLEKIGQEIPTQSDNTQITASSNKHEKCSKNIKTCMEKKITDEIAEKINIVEKVNRPIPMPPKTLYIETQKTNLDNKTATKRPTSEKKITKSMENVSEVQTLSAYPIPKGNVDKKNHNIVNETVVQRTNLGSKAPLQKTNTHRQVIQDVVNGTSIQTPNINSGVQCQKTNVEKRLIQNNKNEASVQRVAMKNQLPPQQNIVQNQLIQNKGNAASVPRAATKNGVSPQRTNIEKQMIQNEGIETLALPQRPSTSGISSHQPNMRREGISNRAPNMAKNITQNMDSGLQTKAANIKHIWPSSDEQKQAPTYTRNLLATSQANERRLSNQMVYSRPPTAISSTHQPNLLNMTNNMSITTQLYPFFVNGQNIIFIPQQKQQQQQQQRNIPMTQLPTTNSNAVILNGQTNILLNSSFQIPSTSVLSRQSQPPAASMTNNVSSYTSRISTSVPSRQSQPPSTLTTNSNVSSNTSRISTSVPSRQSQPPPTLMTNSNVSSNTSRIRVKNVKELS